MLIIRPGTLANSTNKSFVRYEYCIHPTQLPVMTAQGVGLRSPKDPWVNRSRSDRTGAANVMVARITPRLGQSRSRMMYSVEGAIILLL